MPSETETETSGFNIANVNPWILGGGALAALFVLPKLIGGLFGGNKEGEEKSGGLFSLGNLLIGGLAAVAGWLGYNHFLGDKTGVGSEANTLAKNHSLDKKHMGPDNADKDYNTAYDAAVSSITGALKVAENDKVSFSAVESVYKSAAADANLAPAVADAYYDVQEVYSGNMKASPAAVENQLTNAQAKAATPA